jgi:hypothetical protein
MTAPLTPEQLSALEQKASKATRGMMTSYDLGEHEGADIPTMEVSARCILALVQQVRQAERRIAQVEQVGRDAQAPQVDADYIFASAELFSMAYNDREACRAAKKLAEHGINLCAALIPLVERAEKAEAERDRMREVLRQIASDCSILIRAREAGPDSFADGRRIAIIQQRADAALSAAETEGE